MPFGRGSSWTVSAWRGIAGPKGMPADVQQRLVTAIKKIWDSKEFKDFATSRGFGMEWAPSTEFASISTRPEAKTAVSGDSLPQQGNPTPFSPKLVTFVRTH